MFNLKRSMAVILTAAMIFTMDAVPALGDNLHSDDSQVVALGDESVSEDDIDEVVVDEEKDDQNEELTDDSTSDNSANKDDAQKDDGAVSENTADADSISENTVSDDAVSENVISENAVSENAVSENSLSENTVSMDSVSDNLIEEGTAPTDIYSYLRGDQSAVINWTAVGSASKYKIYRLKSSDGSPDRSNPIATVNAPTVSYTDTNLKGIGTNYIYGYMVEALDSSDINIADKYVLVAPLITSVKTGEGGKMDVTFTVPPNTSNLTNLGYEVAYDTVAAGAYTTKSTASTAISNQYLFSSGQRANQRVCSFAASYAVGNRYYFKVSYKADITKRDLSTFNLESGYSSAASGVYSVRAPRAGIARSDSYSSAYISWEDMNEETPGDFTTSDSYVIYYSKNNGAYTKYATINESDARLIDIGVGSTNAASKITNNMAYALKALNVTGLDSEATYKFKVSALKSGGTEGDQSNEMTARVSLTDVTGMTGSSSKKMDKITIKWNAVPGATGYKIYYTKTPLKSPYNNGTTPITSIPAGKFNKVKKVGAGTRKFSLTKLKGSESYAFKVVAIGSNGVIHQQTLSAANGIIVRTKLAATKKITVKQKKNKLTFTWKPVDKATGYMVKYVVGSRSVDVGGPGVTQMKTKKFSKGATSIKIGDLEVGVPVAVRVYSMYEKNGAKGAAALGKYRDFVGYLAPQELKVEAVTFNEAGKGATIYMKKASTDNVNTYTTNLGYRIYRSDKKKKGYKLVGESLNPAKKNGYYVFNDNTAMKAGKTFHYRIYAIARNNAYGSGVIESTAYTQKTYGTPSAVKTSEIKIGKGETKKITIDLTPNKDIFLGIDAFYLSEGTSKTDLQEAVKLRNGALKSNYSNSYVTFTKIEDYDDYSGCYSQKISMKGLKPGTTYMRVELPNGVAKTIKITVTSSSSKANSKVIVLDPGHGGDDQGATSGSLKEASLNLKISKYTKEYLEKDGYTVYMTRSGDSSVELQNRVTMYKSKKPAAIVSQHINSGTGNGLECYYSIDGTGQDLAKNLVSKTVSKTGMSSRGAKTKRSETESSKDYYAIIRYSRDNDMVGVIMENGFIQGDSGKMDSDSDLKKIAEGNANGIKATYN